MINFLKTKTKNM